MDASEQLGGQGLWLSEMTVFWHEISHTLTVSARDYSLLCASLGPILLSLEGALTSRAVGGPAQTRAPNATLTSDHRDRLSRGGALGVSFFPDGICRDGVVTPRAVRLVRHVAEEIGRLYDSRAGRARRVETMGTTKLDLGLCLALLLASTQATSAASWPERPIHWIVPYPPGGGTDLVARVISAQLEKALGQPVIIDNRPGGSTVTGSAMLASAKPDGYTVGMVFDSLAINTMLGVSTPYNPETAFAPIIKLADAPLVFTVNTQQVPMKTLPELVNHSKSHSSWFTFGSLGPGSPHEIGFLWFKAMSKMDALVVPYKGIAPALQDVVAGQVKGMFVGVSVADGYIDQGVLHTLAVTSPKRLPNAPNIPTIAEQGYPDYDFVSFYGLAAPKGTPREIVERLNSEINRVFQLPDVRARFAKAGAGIGGGAPEDFGKLLAENFVKFKKIMPLTREKSQ